MDGDGGRGGGGAAPRAWTSALSTAEFAAVRSVGFEPVGQVMGSAVYRIVRRTAFPGYYYCGDRKARGSALSAVAARVAVSGDGALSAALVQTYTKARRAALDRMASDCAALGGDGVVAARLRMQPFAAQPHCLEFQVIGTAIRGRTSFRPRRPFTTHLDGQGFAKLAAAGFVPVELLFGMSIGVRHMDWLTRGQKRMFARNQEVTGWTDLITRTRADARTQLREQARRSGADGAILGDADLRVWSERCRATNSNNDAQVDHIAEATLLGSAIAAFGRRRAPQPARTLTVLPLDAGAGERPRTVRRARRPRP